jgi:hypothetical protein
MSNKDTLIVAVSEWLGNIASSVMPQVSIPPQSAIGRMMSGFLGINPANYNIWRELGFLINPTILTFVEPQMRKYMDAIPDDKIEEAAMAYADALLTQAREKGSVNVFGVELGAKTFEGLKDILNEKFNSKTSTL